MRTTERAGLSVPSAIGAGEPGRPPGGRKETGERREGGRSRAGPRWRGRAGKDGARGQGRGFPAPLSDLQHLHTCGDCIFSISSLCFTEAVLGNSGNHLRRIVFYLKLVFDNGILFYDENIWGFLVKKLNFSWG